MAKEKKAKTPTQQVKQYKRIGRACFIGEFVSAATPFITIGLINYNKYFVQFNGTKLSIAAVMAFAVMGLAIWLVSKKKFSNSFITLLIGWACGVAILFLVDEIIYDLKFIMLFGLIGLVGTAVLDKFSANANAKAERKQKAIDEGELQMDKDAYIQEKQEREEKKKKIVIIKKK